MPLNSPDLGDFCPSGRIVFQNWPVKFCRWTGLFEVANVVSTTDERLHQNNRVVYSWSAANSSAEVRELTGASCAGDLQQRLRAEYVFVFLHRRGHVVNQEVDASLLRSP